MLECMEQPRRPSPCCEAQAGRCTTCPSEHVFCRGCGRLVGHVPVARRSVLDCLPRMRTSSEVAVAR